MKYLVGGTVLIVTGLILTLMVRLGAFRPVELTYNTRGPIKVVYKPHVGPYHQIVPTIEEVESWAKQNGEPCRLSFGEYLDDTDLTDEDRLRSNGGCVVEKDWSKGLPPGFQYRVIPNHGFVLATFEGAPSIGPLKVYPKVDHYVDENGLVQNGPVYEFYEILGPNAVRTTYWFTVAHQGEKDPVVVSPEYRAPAHAPLHTPPPTH